MSDEDIFGDHHSGLDSDEENKHINEDEKGKQCFDLFRFYLIHFFLL